MNITLTLGHPADSIDPILGPTAATVAATILNELDGIDQQIIDARGDSMAREIDGIKVDFTAQLVELRAEGSRLLKQLARVSGLPLVYDRYTGRSIQVSVVPPYMVLG